MKSCCSGLGRLGCLLLAGLVAIEAAWGGEDSSPGEPNKPNILFIFADDQCFETLGAFGHPVIKTPHLDRLVASGTTFTYCYNQGSWSGAVCVASRTMLNTGRFLWNAQAVYRNTDGERAAGRFWPLYLRKAGYRTYFTGKWHLRTDAAKAFDVADHVRPGMPNQTQAGYNRPKSPADHRWTAWDKQFGGYWKGGRHWSEIVAEDAIGYLGDAARGDQPFFMYVAFNAPHDPRQSPRDYVEKYPLQSVDVPVNYLPEYPHKDHIGCGRNLRDEKLGPFPRTKYAIQMHRQEYYAIITHMDAQIGRILKALEASGQKDNTLIIFTADHGLAVGHHGLFGKQNMYDHSVRVPLVVAGPGIPNGRSIAAPVYLQDVMPTTLQSAGVEPPEHVQFRSLWPLIQGRSDQAYHAIYGAYLNLQRMVTVGNHKLILYPKIGKIKLFNLTTDPHEMHDLAEDPNSKKTIKQLFNTLLGLQKETGDSLNLGEAFPELAF